MRAASQSAKKRLREGENVWITRWLGSSLNAFPMTVVIENTIGRDRLMALDLSEAY
jgi:hypothetical protein